MIRFTEVHLFSLRQDIRQRRRPRHSMEIISLQSLDNPRQDLPVKVGKHIRLEQVHNIQLLELPGNTTEAFKMLPHCFGQLTICIRKCLVISR